MGQSSFSDDMTPDGASTLAEGQGHALPTKIYGRVKETIRNGDVYSLTDPCRAGAVCVLYVAADRRMAVAMRMDLEVERCARPLMLTLLGLDPMLRYTARMTCGGALPDGFPANGSGSFYMTRRFPVALSGDVRGAALVLDAGADS